MRPPPRRRILLAVAGTLAGVALILVALWGVLRLPATDAVPPVPDREPPAELRARLHAEQTELLNSWGWVDREQGRVHIPIDVAIEKLIEKRE